MTNNPKIQINYFTDILCIWAYISEIRIEELQQEFSESVVVQPYFFSIFGDVKSKMIEKGSVEVYASHVQHIASQYEHIALHPNVWTQNTPTSSIPAHIYLCAANELSKQHKLVSNAGNILAATLRKRFFTEAADISSKEVIRETIEFLDWPISSFEQEIASGNAHAALARSLKKGTDLQINVSPTIVFNENRQRLAGNVGYRVIHANITELLNHPQREQAWC